MEFKDFRGRKIELSDDSWAHIQESHPEVSLEEIREVLSDPTEVIECPRQKFVELFYRIKLHKAGKQRFREVAMKKGRSLYKKGESK